jgi:hypothetical protein
MYGAIVRQATLAALLLSPAVASAVCSIPWRRVDIADPATRHAFRAALDGATRWLDHPACRAVFSDFEDQAGRPLDRKLAELGLRPREYLQLILFVDGSDLIQCRDGDALAVTSPGSRVVHVCARRFVREWSKNSRQAQAAAVHEALHSLGLGENPPTSAQITSQVLRRCNR